MRAQLDAIDRTKVSPEINLKIGRAFAEAKALDALISDDGDSDAISRSFGRLASTLGQVADAGGAAGDAVSQAGSQAVGFGTRAAGVAAGGAIQMVAGFAALVVAGAFLLPIIIALVGAFVALAGSLAAALAVVGAVSVAFGAVLLGALAGVAAVIATVTQGMERQEEASQKLAAAEDRHRQAIEARKAAHAQLMASGRAVEDAQYREALAAEGLAQAYIDAERALEDLQNRQDSAALSAKQAAINVARARKELERIEREGGTRLERQQARLDLKTALEAQDQAQLEATRSNEDLAKAEAKGIAGADNVVAAQREVEEARKATIEALKAQARAQDEFDRAQRRSQRTAEAMARRQRHVDNARRGGIGGLSRAVDQIQRVFKWLGRAFKPVIRAISGGIRDFAHMLRDLEPAIRRTAGVFGRVIGRIARELTKPAWQRFYRLILRTMRELAGPAGRIFTSLANIFRKIATAAMPLLVKGFESIARWLTEVNRRTTASEIEKWIRGLLPAFRAWKRLIVAIGDVLLALFDSGKGQGTKLVNWIAKGIEDFVKWLRDPKNKGEIKKFFKDAIDLTRQLIKLMVRMGRTMIHWFRKGKPYVVRMLHAFEDMLATIEEILDKIPSFGDIRDFLGGEGYDPVIEGFSQAHLDAAGMKLNDKGEVVPKGKGKRHNRPNRPKGPGRDRSAAAAAAGGNHVEINLTVPGGGSPDPEATVAAIGRRLRDKGLALG